jgi:hypothetical protein
MDAGWNASAKRYTGGKVLVANLPGVDICSTIEVEYEVNTKARPFISGFETFQTFDDLDKKEVKLTAPAESPADKEAGVRAPAGEGEPQAEPEEAKA